MQIERRAFALDGVELRAADGGGQILRGHAAVFNLLSDDLGGFREKISPGAFAKAIAEDDVRALFNHDRNYVLGRSKSGTLRMREDGQGLAVEIDLPDNQTIRDLVLGPIARGDVSQMSFGFRVAPGGQAWAKDGEGRAIRTLTSLRLFDVSAVTYPAYPDTDVAVRELRSWTDSQANTPPAAQPRLNLLAALSQQAAALN